MKKAKTLFEAEKLAAYKRISKELLNDTEFKLDNYEDYLNETMTATLSSYIYNNMAEKRELIYYCDRPSFLDWLLRRSKKVIFNLEVRDLLLNAPKTNNTMRIYIVNR